VSGFGETGGELAADQAAAEDGDLHWMFLLVGVLFT
jgi:hypothetical protein